MTCFGKEHFAAARLAHSLVRCLSMHEEVMARAKLKTACEKLHGDRHGEHERAAKEHVHVTAGRRRVKAA